MNDTSSANEVPQEDAEVTATTEATESSENKSSENKPAESNGSKAAATSKVKQSYEGGYDETFEAEEVTVKSLLKAGAHFGHKTERWNPKMLPYIYGERNNIHIINLDETYKHWLKARKFVVDIISRGGSMLFVGTKLQGRPLVVEAATRSGSYYVTNRWLGGALSNFQTMKNSMRRMKNLEDLLEKAEDETSQVRIAKKERLAISRQVEKLEHNLGGIREMRKLPDVLFVLDIKKEAIAVAEARKLHIPVVALVDTNVDPGKVDLGIPSNDDAYKTIKLFVDGMAAAVIEGKKVFKNRMHEQSMLHAKASGKRSKQAAPSAEENASEVGQVH